MVADLVLEGKLLHAEDLLDFLEVRLDVIEGRRALRCRRGGSSNGSGEHGGSSGVGCWRADKVRKSNGYILSLRIAATRN